ncbi:MAG: DUF3347 domain-containing protein [Ferruginibacter sp.]
MRALYFLIILGLLGFGVYWYINKQKPSKPKAEKQAPITLRQHSDSFNTRIDNLVTAYLQTKDAFVSADTAGAKNNTRNFLKQLDALPLSELKNNDLVYQTALANAGDLKSNAESLLAQPNVTEMRKDFSSLTEIMYPSFLRTVNYDGEKLYLQNCPMAFDDEVGANWISNSVEIVNPYLGSNHPKYKAGMLHCGEIKDTIKAQP